MMLKLVLLFCVIGVVVQAQKRGEWYLELNKNCASSRKEFDALAQLVAQENNMKVQGLRMSPSTYEVEINRTLTRTERSNLIKRVRMHPAVIGFTLKLIFAIPVRLEDPVELPDMTVPVGEKLFDAEDEDLVNYEDVRPTSRITYVERTSKWLLILMSTKQADFLTFDSIAQQIATKLGFVLYKIDIDPDRIDFYGHYLLESDEIDSIHSPDQYDVHKMLLRDSSVHFKSIKRLNKPIVYFNLTEKSEQSTRQKIEAPNFNGTGSTSSKGPSQNRCFAAEQITSYLSSNERICDAESTSKTSLSRSRWLLEMDKHHFDALRIFLDIYDSLNVFISRKFRVAVIELFYKIDRDNYFFLLEPNESDSSESIAAMMSELSLHPGVIQLQQLHLFSDASAKKATKVDRCLQYVREIIEKTKATEWGQQ